MSTVAEVLARFARSVPRQAEYPKLSPSEACVPLVFKRIGPLEWPITVAWRLREEGVPLKVAHDVITRLAEISRATCGVGPATDIDRLAADLAPLNVVVRENAAFEDVVQTP